MADKDVPLAAGPDRSGSTFHVDEPDAVGVVVNPMLEGTNSSLEGATEGPSQRGPDAAAPCSHDGEDAECTPRIGSRTDESDLARSEVSDRCGPDSVKLGQLVLARTGAES